MSAGCSSTSPPSSSGTLSFPSIHFGTLTISHGTPVTCDMANWCRGDTRRVEGELKDTGHDEGSGEFDSSQIVMKRWAEFERDRRRKQLAAQQYEIPGPMPLVGATRPSSSRGASSLRGYDMGYV
jgi:hypothetical protein